MFFKNNKVKVYTLIVRFKNGNKIKTVRYCSNTDKTVIIKQMRCIIGTPTCKTAHIIIEKNI